MNTKEEREIAIEVLEDMASNLEMDINDGDYEGIHKHNALKKLRKIESVIRMVERGE